MNTRQRDISEWTMATGSEGGFPVLIRTRVRPPHGNSSKDFPDTVDIVWRFEGGGTNGMPTTDLSALMMECEDALDSLESSTSGFLGISMRRACAASQAGWNPRRERSALSSRANVGKARNRMNARSVLIAWIAFVQLLAFPFVAFGAFMGLVAVPLRLQYWLPITIVVGLSLLIEVAVAWLCARKLRERLRDRLTFSSGVVALASSLGLLAGTLLAVALAQAAETADVPLEPILQIPISAASLVSGSALGTLLGCRYRPA